VEEKRLFKLRGIYMNKLINLIDLADYLGVSVRQLQNIRKSKSFPSAVRLGKTKLAYRMNDIDAWINSGGVIEGVEL
jgi:predicted DNA-binding transcriptional regulator AlpA